MPPPELKKVLASTGAVAQGSEFNAMSRVLDAAALTYVAAFLSASRRVPSISATPDHGRNDERMMDKHGSSGCPIGAIFAQRVIAMAKTWNEVRGWFPIHAIFCSCTFSQPSRHLHC